MEVGEMSNKKEPQVEVPWVPTTPVKPILQKPVPIYSPGEGNQLPHHANGAVACPEFTPGKEKNNMPDNGSLPEATMANIAGDNSKTCAETAFGCVPPGFGHLTFSQLILLAEAGSVNSNATQPDSNGLKNPFIPSLKSQFNGDQVTNTASAVHSHHHLPLQSPIIQDRSRDPHGTSYIACWSNRTSQDSPFTPDTAIGLESRQIASMQINMEEKNPGVEEKNVPAEKLDNNGTPLNKELCDPVVEFATISTPSKENHNPDTGSSHVLNLNKTPQQKQRRRKHRPKVIIEGKPKRTRKAATQKNVQPKENPTGKRKYVRKKGVNKSSTTPAEETAELIKDLISESAKRSCRRSLNFDVEARDENSVGRENATVHLSKEIGVAAQETNAGSMEQAPNNNTPLPEEAQDPSKSSPPEAQPKEKPTAKRQYKRRERLNKSSTSPAEMTGELNGALMPKSNKISRRRSLNFDKKARDECSAGGENLNVCISKENSVVAEEMHANLAYDQSTSMKQAINIYISLPVDTQAQSTSPSKGNSPGTKPKQKPTGKRTYVRRKGVSKTSTPTAEMTEAMMPESTKMSCRRSLNFDIGARDESSMCKENLNVHIGKENSVVVKETHVGLAYDQNTFMNQAVCNYMSLPEDTKAPSISPSESNSPGAKLNVNFNSVENKTKRNGQAAAQDEHENSANILLKSVAKLSPNGSVSQMVGSKRKHSGSQRKHSGSPKHPDTSSKNLIGAQYNGLPSYQTKCWVQFPNIQKKRRSGKGKSSELYATSSMTTTNEVHLTCPQEDARGHPYSSSSNCWIFNSEYNASYATRVPAIESVIDSTQTFEEFKLSLRRLNERSSSPTQICDWASLTRIKNCYTEPSYTTKQQAISDRQTLEDAVRPLTCIDALVAEMCASLTKKKRNKKKSALCSSADSSTNDMQQHLNFALGSYHLRLGKSLDIAHEVIWKTMHDVDALAEQFRQLNMNTEGRVLALHEQNALVPYKQQKKKQNSLILGDGTIIPFQGPFDPIKKQHPRPKVDLDEETDRVWKLLMLDINSHGIDGTDEDKAKWWEEERNVFRGRADSFIARMHLVQGDRRFSQWKGSVVDSVVGVFLTQNVSDHLSSSAFMSLAARYPQKSSSTCKTSNGEGTSLVVKEPQVHIVEPEENTEWDVKSLNQSVHDRSSMTMDIVEHSGEKEAVNSNDSCRTTSSVTSLTDESNSRLPESSQIKTEEREEKSCYECVRTELNDIVSSQSSVIASQISADFSNDQNPEKVGSCSDSNSEVEDLSSTAKYNSIYNSTSFSRPVEMASSTKLQEVDSQRSKSTEKLIGAYCQSIDLKNDNPTEKMEKSNVTEVSLEASIIPSHEYTLKTTPNSAVPEANCSDPFKTEASSSGFLKDKDENDKNRPCFQRTESAGQVVISHSQRMVAQVHPREKSNHMQQNSLNVSGPTQDVMQKERRLDLGDHKDALSNETNEVSSTPMKLKSRGQGKEKKDDFNWDSLRIKAQAKAGKREKTENTMDSLDWGAVRLADVSEISDVIKERGMNNRLAERIKNFLNRLVEEHGDIDLEWLRDVPPDQAKEYLLSIRGLGLKSVECVRLLTLHHLAFPVDTNVGRIAVRLGWVPLQPLPESLQLHLLELYPVLESIQKYLWPRLCKLDQRTLYELHYQMITFGKVFCTKSKPNCNACPMRGECRHFASAFASARLALPGPEPRSIVSTSGSGNNATDQNPSVIINQLHLPHPENANQGAEIQQTELSRQLQSKSQINICQPIIEEPTTPEPECSQVLQNDMEDAFCEDSCEIPTIDLNIEEFTLNLQNYMQKSMELQEGEMSKALVALTPEAASIPMPKLKNVGRLRTEHCVYELPDTHPLLEGWDTREPDDPGKYLLAIWTPGETANSIQPPESKCSSQECGQLCNEKECYLCNSFREANLQTVRGTLLIPCRTAMRGSFPLNGTYFQVNEVFADHDSSLNPINVPRSWIWNLNRRTVYFGTSVPTIFKGLSTQEIQQCFWRGYVCVRGFDRATRAPRPLMARLHFPASKMAKTKENTRKKSTAAKPQGLKPNPGHPELLSNSHNNLQERDRA